MEDCLYVLFLEGKKYRMLSWGNLQDLRKDRNKLISEGLYTWLNEQLLFYLMAAIISCHGATGLIFKDKKTKTVGGKDRI